MDHAKQKQVKSDNQNAPVLHRLDPAEFDRGNASLVSNSFWLSNKKIVSNQLSWPISVNKSEMCSRIDGETSPFDEKNIDQDIGLTNQRERTHLSKHNANAVEEKSRLRCNNVPRKRLIIALSAFILGCLTIVGLILPNVFLYLMLPTLCKSSIL